MNEGVDGGNPLTQPVLPPSCLNPLADAGGDDDDGDGDDDGDDDDGDDEGDYDGDDASDILYFPFLFPKEVRYKCD